MIKTLLWFTITLLIALPINIVGYTIGFIYRELEISFLGGRNASDKVWQWPNTFGSRSKIK